MKIYTRGGDEGQTRIYADKPLKVSKDDAILRCYGDIDELNSHIGVLISLSEIHQDYLQHIQQHLFQLGYVISATSSLHDNDVTALEQQIDALSDTLPAQTHFILPGGCHAAAQAHVCRTVCRRAERTLVSVAKSQDVSAAALAYINRLSDYFFVLARSLNQHADIADVGVPTRA
ncbi:cob(I)yrinic acid a,c-diamide adenosyltransferase [Salinimonas sp. HHU 13199]|uniref:Corrinoid adenosyltransferase n=1 Tax=Salinimonas profundi TaxID=2729140 RepID=A0ABR8LF17_9ALTE|nr:cob(I)yrinic acid a,c-diamide adenosyltransferase [Salinimonas profundi]MBD3584860.1 cob(I)yrinic acid a,c-diamide adenosyltransferase [Salinimonas profundi]